NAHRVVGGVRGDEVDLGIAVDITSDHRDGTSASRKVLFGGKGSVAATQKNADSNGAVVCNHKVEFAIAVEVGRHHRIRIGAVDIGGDNRVGARASCEVQFAEGSIAVADENAHGIGLLVCGDEVKLSIAVDIDGDDRARVPVGSKILFGAKGPVANTEQDAH